MNKKKIVALGLMTAVACSNLGVLATANPEKPVKDTVVLEAGDLFIIGLEIAVEEAGEITAADLEDVVPVVVAEFNEALQEAQDLLASIEAGDTVTQGQVDGSLERLTGALHLLSHKGDKTDLDTLVTEIGALNADDYTTESWTALQNVLKGEVVQSVINDENALNADILVAYNLLVAAKGQLVENVEVAPSAPTPTITNITETEATITWTTPENSLEEIAKYILTINGESQEVVANETGSYSVNITDLESGTVYTASLKAIGVNGMESEAVVTEFETLVAVDKSELQELVDSVDGLVEADYTAGSWAKFETALGVANGVLTNEAATQVEVDDAKTALQAAIDGLKEVGQEEGMIIDLVAPSKVNVLDTANYQLDLDEKVEGVKVTYTWNENGKKYTFSDTYKVETPGSLEIDRVLRFARNYKVKFTPIVDGKELSKESETTTIKVIERDDIKSVAGNGDRKSTTIDKVGDAVKFTIKTSTDVNKLEFNFTTSNNYKEYYTEYEDVDGVRIWKIVRPIRTNVNKPHEIVISAISDGYVVGTSNFTVVIGE